MESVLKFMQFVVLWCESHSKD